MDEYKVRKAVHVLQGLLNLAEEFVEPEGAPSARCFSGSVTDNRGLASISAPVSGYLVQATVGDMDMDTDVARLTLRCGLAEDYAVRHRTYPFSGWTVIPFDFRVKKGNSVYVVVEEGDGEGLAKAGVPVTLTFLSEAY